MGAENGIEARRHVLVIDDEESLRHAVKRGLEREGLVAHTAQTGREGIDAFVEGRFDAVLTDVRLPDISGLDIVAVLTEMDPGVPVIVMTGYGTLQTALDAMRRGARDYVQKPFSVEEVIRVLCRAVDERRLNRENRRLRALVERRLEPEQFEAARAVEAELDDRAEQEEPPASAASLLFDAQGEPLPLREAQRAFEVRYVEMLLARTGGNIAAAARLAGISRPNFHKKLRALDVQAARFKDAARRGRTHDL